MSAATKSGLLLCGVLLLGLLLGFAGSNAVRERGRGPVGGGRGGPRSGLAQHFEDVIQPRDSAQAHQVREILERRAEKNRILIRTINDSLRISIDELKRELNPLLDDAQRRRLDDAMAHLPPVGGGGPGGHAGMRGGPPDRGGPPPGGFPPPRGGPPPE